MDPQIKGPQEPAPQKFADAYAELQAIEPLVKRANVLAAHCQERIEAVRKLIGDQPAE